MINLSDLLVGFPILEVHGEINLIVNTISFDSRNIIEKGIDNENGLFIAIKGTGSDGHNYINQAISNGAKVVVCENLPKNQEENNNITFVIVKNSSEALSLIAANFFGNPAQKLKIIGITGTNGKTTTGTLLYKLMCELGVRAGLISTVCVRIVDQEFPATLTTPDPIELHKYFKTMVEMGCQYCFMEVSSHSIVQNRVEGIPFVGGVFTNITHDHLDYHKTFQNYLNAKKKFFDNLGTDSFALSNKDDKNGVVMLQNTRALKKYYSLETRTDYFARIIESQINGMRLEINNHDVWFKLVGKFNAQNILAVLGTAVELGFDLQEVLVGLSNLTPVRGRFQVIHFPENIFGIVDYAHTPDALKNILETITDINYFDGRIITVFGCGGNRDKTKRIEMTKIAVLSSNFVILTADNPRFENPNSIINDMYDGLTTGQKTQVEKIVLRRDAINKAVQIAQKNDIILVAGKGHETYQEIEGIRYPFNDFEELKFAFLKKFQNPN